MSEQERKIGFIVAADNQTKGAFQEIKTDAADMAASVQQSGEKAAKGVKGIGDGADEAAQKLARSEGQMSAALRRATEQTKIAAEAGGSLARAFEQKIEMRGLDASKLNPFVQQLRDAETALAAFKAQQSQQASQNSFLESLKAQADAIGKTKAELLELKAAELGLANSAAPYIAKLREADTVVGNVGMSAKATAAAMRGVPAQISDIAVSLQGGMSPMTVFMQQGLQLRDMFGGFGAAAKALGTTLLGIVTPFTVVGAAAAALGLAYYKGSQESEALNKALITTGNQVGVTRSELQEYARDIAKTTGTVGAATNAVIALIGANAAQGDALKVYAQAAMAWSKATGQSVGEVAQNFADLAKDPLKATLKLNDGLNYLSTTIYDQIRALEKQGRTTEAAKLAQDEYARATSQRAEEIKANLGSLERGWNAIADAAKKAWDGMLNVGRQATTVDALSAVRKELADLEKRDGGAFGDTEGGAATGRPSSQAVARIKARIAALKEQETQLVATAAAEKKNAEVQSAQKEAVDSLSAFNQYSERHETKAVKLKKELTAEQTKLNKAIADQRTLLELGSISQAEFNKKESELKEISKNNIAQINKQYAEKPKGGSGLSREESEIAAIKARIAEEEQLAARLREYGAAAEKITPAEKKVAELRAQIGEATNKTVKAEKERALALALSWQAVEKERTSIEDSAKAKEKQLAAMYKSADATATEAEKIEASLGVYGKARTEIERMTLAKLKQKQADMALIANPEYLAALGKQIEEQEKLVDSLQRLDYKKFDDKLSKSLELSKEELAIQQDGLSLLGLDEVQRKRVVAQRKIERDLAKEILAIERAKFSEDPTENTNQQEALKQKAREKAEVDTQIAIGKIQEEYVNQQVQKYDQIFSQGFAGMLNKSKGGWDSFTKSLTTTFKTTVADQIYKMFLRPFAVKVVAQTVGMTGASQELPGTGVAGGSGSWFGSNGSGFSGAGDWLMTQSTELGLNGMSTLSDAAYSLGNTIKGVDTWFKEIPGFGGGLTSALSYAGGLYQMTQGNYGAGAGTMAGAYIGSIVPGIGTAIGAAIGSVLGGLFDSEDIPRYAATAEYRGGATSRGWTPGDQWNDAIYPTVSALAQGIGSALDATAKTFGQTAGYELFASFSKDAENKGVFGALNITGPDGKSLVDWSQYDTKWGGRHFSDGDAGEKEFMAAITADVKTAFQAMDIPTWSKQLINAAENIDGINAALQQIGGTKALFDAWGKSMEMFLGISGELQTQLLNSFGGNVDALASGVGSFFESFFSESERMSILARNLSDSLGGLGISIDPAMGEDAKAQFKAVVEAAMAGGQGELAAKLFAMSESFASAADYAQSQAEQVAQATQEAAKAAADMALNLRNALVSLEGRFAGGGFARQYKAEAAAGTIRDLFAGVGIDKDAGALAQQILAATSTEVEDYFRQMWGMLDTDEARAKLVDVTGVLMDLAEASGSAAQSASDLARKLGTDAASALSAMTSAGSLLDRIDAAKGGSGTGYGLLREQRLWAAMAEADYKQQIDLAGQLTDSVLSRYQLEQQNAQKLIDFGRSLRSYVDGLKLGNLSPLTTGEKLAEAAKQYQSTLAKAQAGDEQAMSALQGISSSYLDLARQYFASSDAYTSIFGNVSSSLDALGVSAQSQADMQLSVASESLGTLNKLQGILEVAYQEAQADYISQSKLLEDQLKAMLGTESGIQAVADAIAGLPAEIAAHFNVLTPASAGVDGSHAGGLAYVPFDGYRAELHKGERVLTAAESRAYQPPIWTNYGTGDGMAAMASEIKAMRAELVQLRAENRQDAQMQVRATVESNKDNAERVVQGVGQSTERAAYAQTLNDGATYK